MLGAVALEEALPVCAGCGGAEAEVVEHLHELSLRKGTWQRWQVLRCHGCDLRYVHPRLHPEALEAIYAGGEYGFERPGLDGPGAERYRQRLLDEVARFRAGGALLDVGCATGEFLAAARLRGWEVQGVELSPYAAALARQRHGLPVFAGTLREARFLAERFDVVTLWDVIEHLPDLRADLEEVRRLLRPGGLLGLETPNWDSIYRRMLGRRWPAYQPRLHLYYFTRASAAGLLARAGFDVLSSRTEVVGFFSAQGRARGLRPRLLRGVLREVMVKSLLLWPDSLVTRAVRAGLGPPKVDAVSRGSFNAQCEGHPSGEDGGGPAQRCGSLGAILDRWLDPFLEGRGMGEQLRVYGRKR
ncbi:MAG: class I SAM-dependent methyltransferase [Chloroflexi bacterium]|nr:class I SAM-dependent methyltransferase [Chloroflexota bacterium]